MAAAAAAGSKPTTTLVNQWNSDSSTPISALLDWAKVVGPLRAAFLAAAEAEEDEPYKSFSLFSEEEAATIIGAVTVNGAPLGILATAKLRLAFSAVWHAARGVPEPPVAVETGGSSAGGAAPATSASGPNVPLNGTTVQTGTEVAPLMPKSEYNALFEVYKTRAGAYCAEEAEPTREQASAFDYTVKRKDTIAVDFAVWVAHAYRMEKRRAMEGMKLDSTGKIVPLVL